jgi:hypothetical protein
VNGRESTGKKNRDYYDRIKDVIDRFLKRRNDKESAVADAFLVDREEYGKKENDETASRPRRPTAGASRSGGRSGGGRPSLSGGILDLSWKDGGTTYPKRSSQIGEEYQATEIPAAGSVGAEKATDHRE